MVHNVEVKQVETEEIIADEMWSFVQKKRTAPSEGTSDIGTEQENKRKALAASSANQVI